MAAAHWAARVAQEKGRIPPQVAWADRGGSRAGGVRLAAKIAAARTRMARRAIVVVLLIAVSVLWTGSVA